VHIYFCPVEVVDLEQLMLSMKVNGVLFVMMILILKMQKLCVVWLDIILCKL